MRAKPLIMVVEDETRFPSIIPKILASNGFNFLKVGKGKEAISMVTSHCPNLVLLDMRLPDMDGIEVLKNIRERTNVPVIVVLARKLELQKAEVADLGADDYVIRPFGTFELLTRIRTVLRRSHSVIISDAYKSKKVVVDELKLNTEKRQVSKDGMEIHLTPKEYRIIALLSEQQGKTLTYDYISKEIWGPHATVAQTLRVNMANIRKKIETNPAEPRYIVTEVGVGYRMVEY